MENNLYFRIYFIYSFQGCLLHFLTAEFRDNFKVYLTNGGGPSIETTTVLKGGLAHCRKFPDFPPVMMKDHDIHVNIRMMCNLK